MTNTIPLYFQCTVLTACGEECVIATKVNTAMAILIVMMVRMKYLTVYY